MTDVTCEYYNITPEDLFKYAKENNEKAQVDFRPVLDVISDALPEDMQPIQEGEDSLYILRNKVNDSGVYTSAAILSEKTIQAVADKFGENFYILPSSIQEVLLVPETYARSKSLPFLKQTVEEVNKEVVEADLFLSNNIYYCDAEKKFFELVNSSSLSMNGR